jgi:imidazolonepropionase-like amidohydrolase
LADIIARELDPTQDNNTVLNEVFVIKNGVVYK